MPDRRSAAPRGLRARGKRFWRLVQDRYELEPDEVELLVEICRCLDLVEDLQALLDADGLRVRGSEGQPRIHPAVGEQRGARALLGRLLAQPGLPHPDDETLPSPRQVRARNAARSRWDRVAKARERRAQEVGHAT